MDYEVQLISDGEGLAVIGEPAAVDAFLASEGLSSVDLGMQRLRSAVGAGAAAVQAGSEIAANSGRWVKLTKESASAASKYGLRTSSKTGLSTGVLKGKRGQIRGIVEFTKGPGTILTNPAVLSGAAGIMAQLAMQQAMDEITDYLAKIEAKLDDVLRAQKDSELADMDGVAAVIKEAMTVREQVGRVSEINWSKVQGTSETIAATQGYALRQLNALAQKLERIAKVGDLAKAAKEAEPAVHEWLSVLARCFQLQEAIGVLELDRVLEATPDELDLHRLGLRVARQSRLKDISLVTRNLMARMDAAAGLANSKVLLHPSTSPAVIRSSREVSAAVSAFHGRLGIEHRFQAPEARGWVDAAVETAVDTAFTVAEAGAKSVDTAVRVGNEFYGLARSVTVRRGSGSDERGDRKRSEEEGGAGESQ